MKYHVPTPALSFLAWARTRGRPAYLSADIQTKVHCRSTEWVALYLRVKKAWECIHVKHHWVKGKLCWKTPQCISHFSWLLDWRRIWKWSCRPCSVRPCPTPLRIRITHCTRSAPDVKFPSWFRESTCCLTTSGVMAARSCLRSGGSRRSWRVRGTCRW